MASILSFGGVYLDINATNFPIPSDANQLINTETVGNQYEMVVGGSAVNMARFSSKLGMQTFFIGKIGNDKPAQMLKELFLDEGIFPLLIEDSTKITNLNTNLVGAHGESLMLSFGNANQAFSLQEVLSTLKKHIDSIDYVYFGGVFKLKTILSGILDLAKKIKAHNKKIIVDHGRVVNTATSEEKEIVRQLALNSDIYLPSKDEFLELWGVENIEQGFSVIASTAKQSLTVVKDADNGAFIIEDGRVLHVPAFKVDAVNTVGAGDSFNAGFLCAYTKSKSLEGAVRFANAVAALKISTNTFPTKQKIDILLQDK